LGFLIATLVGRSHDAMSAARARTPFSIEMLMSIAAVRAVIIGVTEEAG
jgi:Zn2+/Cd2+-exporting ATPase